MWASACSSSLDRRETRAFYFIVCVLLAVSASSGSTTTQELRGRKQRKQRRRRTKIQRKSSKNRSKIDEKSLLGSFGRSRPCRGRVGTRSGRLLDAQKSLQGRSWGAPGAPRAAKSRPKASPGRSQDTAGPPRSDVRAHSEHQAVSNEPAERFFDVFLSSRKSSDVRKM